MRLTLTLMFALLTFSPAHAEEEFDFSVDAEGKVEVDGEAFKPRGPVTTWLFAEVEKTLPGMEGQTIVYLKPIEFRQPNKKNVAAVESVKVDGDAKPFSHSLDWQMYDAEGQPTDDPRQAFRVLMPAPTEGDAMAFDVVWRECEGNVTGNYNGYGCSNRRGLADDYAAYIKVNMLPCVTAGLRSAGVGGTATKVHLVHNGTVADQNHSSRSLHAAGRAIDVKTMRITATSGNHEFVFEKASRNSKGRERKFFQGFRSCWHSLQMKRRCPSRNDGPTGTIGWEDRRHQHHMHTSLPFCPNRRGWYITEGEDLAGAKTRVPASKQWWIQKK